MCCDEVVLNSSITRNREECAAWAAFDMAELTELVLLWPCSASPKEIETSTMLLDTRDPALATLLPLITDSVNKRSKLDGLLASIYMDDVPIDAKASAMIHMFFSRKLV